LLKLLPFQDPVCLLCKLVQLLVSNISNKNS